MVRFTLLNTRPLHQAKALDELVNAAGGESLSCPTLSIQFLQSHLSQLPEPVDKLIFISANAVDALCAQRDQQRVRELVESAQSYAIGNATANKAKQLGIDIALFSNQQFDSERFLMDPSMQNVRGQNIVLAKGVNGRTLLKETLQDRGANVVDLALYKRQKNPLCSVAWRRFCLAQDPFLLITSVESWKSLLTGLGSPVSHKTSSSDHRVLDTVPEKVKAVVMSQRIARQMRSDGWQNSIEVVKIQSNQGIIDAI